jgi:hypothetical protein
VSQTTNRGLATLVSELKYPGEISKYACFVYTVDTEIQIPHRTRGSKL